MKKLLSLPVALAALLAGGAVGIVRDQCGPFTDVTPSFCPYILELYYLGITAGTSATTYSPDDPLTRGQAAVFIAKGLNQSLARNIRRAALGQWWSAAELADSQLLFVGSLPFGAASDGADIWVTSVGDSSVSRVRASDGKVLGTWTGAPNALAVLVAMGRVFLTRNYPPSSVFMIDPTQPPGDVVPVTDDLGLGAYALAFDGGRLWVSNGTVSIVTPGPTVPWKVTTLSNGGPGLVYDGRNMWVTSSQSILKLDSSGAILQTVPLGGDPGFPVFDGANIWVPLQNPGGVDVVSAGTGAVIGHLTGNGLTTPYAAAFDGDRVLITNPSGNSVSLWRAASLTPLGFISTGDFSFPLFACSDGINFWITLNGTSKLARF